MIPVVDVFAGPGGLNEGFASLSKHGKPVFSIASSIEMDEFAVRTLRLRAAVRSFSDRLPPVYREFLEGRRELGALLADEAFGDAHAKAGAHVHQLELGAATRAESDGVIADAVSGAADWVLIGGPPCQAYSLAGRSRRRNDEKFFEDHKHFLYREYLHIIEKFKPSVFVMENVKGLLSAKNIGEGGMFDRILDDLSLGGDYEVRSLVVADQPSRSDFVIRAEQYGVPQRRHRVILLGVRTDRGFGSHTPLERRAGRVTVRGAIGHLPPVTPRVSRTSRSQSEELQTARTVARTLASTVRDGKPAAPAAQVDEPATQRLAEWLNPHGLDVLTLHEPRRHMRADLERYVFYALLADRGINPSVKDLPKDLRPAHKNLDSDVTPFIDRFKVQEWDRPSSTVASHIAKDGHYYIHPDANQSRSLTVREAARLQTFPDDYWFCGPRTMQYRQVGNAVPPLLAHQIADRVATLLGH